MSITLISRSNDVLVTRVAYIGLGANVGDPRMTLQRAVAALAGVGDVVAVSHLWKTAPQLLADQPPFLNAVAAIRVRPMPVDEFVAILKSLERTLGRVPGVRYGPRVIDLDLLHYAGATTVETTGEVVVPHPRLAERRFVLAPFNEIAPDERDPRSGKTIAELAKNVTDQPAEIVDEGTWWKTASS